MEEVKSKTKKLSEQELDERVARAVENFMQGYGCCQSVVAAFADLYGMDDVMAKKIAAGFGGGVGRMRMMCGHEKAQNSYVASARTAEYYKTRPCAAKVESAARIFADYLKQKRAIKYQTLT